MLSIRSMSQLPRVLSRQIHTSKSLRATTELTMPALSPTMTEGSITEWKFKVGESFTAGEVLLQIETDKASIEVEAQDDGIMGMILVQNDTSGVQVGAVIALLIEEGDDISSLKAPSPSTPSTPAPAPSTPTPALSPVAATPSPAAKPSPPPPAPSPRSSNTVKTDSSIHPHHPLPLLPSVHRLLVLNNISDATIIKSTGSKGMLTKGDVLAFLGKISNPRGASAASETLVVEEKKVEKKVEVALDGAGLRRLIATGLGEKKVVREEVPGFDQILDEYLPLSMRSVKKINKIESIPGKGKVSFDNLLDL